ncbi:LuxR C-terminal-related transcriptional regulator [Lentzea tibetensis]|nr:LuxR C-terminal-related transcriptional regulator [Lentzea tibetensis]
MPDSQEPADGESPVVPSKLRVPVSAVPLVPRDRLLSTLDNMVGASPPAVTLVSGPAGTGKTTVLAEWARRCARGQNAPRIAWITLDAHDNTPAYLWTAIRDALLLSGGWTDPARLESVTLQAPAFAVDVVAAFDHATAPVCLVLDNVHELRAAEVLRTLDILVRHLPERLRLVLAGRFTPGLHLSRLRLEGRLREIGTTELAFTRTEAEALFAQQRIQLTPDGIGVLLRQTGGWIGGLRFAAMAMAGTTTSPAELPLFTGHDEIASAYLNEEVLAQHPDDVRRFLVSTSICDVLSADLAAAVSEHPNAGEVLDLLERTNSFVTRLDEWYRFHPILRGHLRAELGRTWPKRQRGLHRTAARWYSERGMPVAALEHAIHAEQGELTAELVEGAGLREILSSGGERLHELLTTVPHHLLARPVIGLVAALAALDAGDPATADQLLDQVNRSAHPLRSDELRALHATVLVHRARFDGDLGESLRNLSRTTAGRTGAADLDGAALMNRGIAALWRGDHRTAEADLSRASDLARHEGFDHAVLDCQVHLAALETGCGDHRAMHHRATAALEFAAERGWESKPECSLAYALLGVHAYQRMEDDQARALASRAVEVLTRRTDPTTELAASCLDAIVTFGETDEPHAVVGAMWKRLRELDRRQVAPPLVAFVTPTAQRMALHVGEQQWAAEMAEHVDKVLGTCAEPALLRAVVHMHHARAGQARKLVAPILTGELRAVVANTVVDAWLVEATLVDRAGSAQQAHHAICQALAAAEPIDAIRPFLNAGKPIRDLLARGAGRFGRLDPFATATMTALPATSTTSTDVLTTRERDLLVELPSMRTTEEIADSLFVSVNTVKTHLRGIYRKLGVNQRRDAVIVARQRGLI